MGLKSITGSRKVQEVINHFDHSIGYHTAEEYETQIAEQIIERKQVLPDGLQPKKGLSTNSAWDNYDESMYHDTQGIVIQNNFSIAPSMTEEVFVRSENSFGSSLFPKRRHKRSLDIPNTELEPVRKTQDMIFIWCIIYGEFFKLQYLCSQKCCLDNIKLYKQASTNVVWLEFNNKQGHLASTENRISGKH